MITSIVNQIDIDSENITITDVQATFQIDLECVPAEPFSYGQSRPDEYNATAEFFCCIVGTKNIDRYLLVDLVGVAIVDALEEEAANKYIEEMGL